MKKVFDIDKKTLEDLYLNKQMSLTEIGKLYGVNPETVRRKLIKYGIPRKPMSIWTPVHNISKNSELVEAIKEIPVGFYTRKPRNDIDIFLPIEYLEDKCSKKAVLTLVISDLHLGHSDFLPDTFYSAIETLKKILKILKKKFEIVDLKVVLNGDIVSGREVYPMQHLSNLLPRGHWQVFLAEIILKEVFDEISKIVKISTIYMIKGTHENLAENYILYLKRALQGNGYDVFYLSKGCTINIACPIGEYNVFFTHGKGRSDYYPVPLVMIREMWKIKAESEVPIERFCMGHTHFLCPNLELEGIKIDVTGGFQRWEKSHCQRPCGMLLYLYFDKYCSVIPVRPNKEIEIKEKMSSALEYKNIKFYGEKLIEHVQEIEGIKNENSKSSGKDKE